MPIRRDYEKNPALARPMMESTCPFIWRDSGGGKRRDPIGRRDGLEIGPPGRNLIWQAGQALGDSGYGATVWLQYDLYRILE